MPRKSNPPTPHDLADAQARLKAISARLNGLGHAVATAFGVQPDTQTTRGEPVQGSPDGSEKVTSIHDAKSGRGRNPEKRK